MRDDTEENEVSDEETRRDRLFCAVEDCEKPVERGELCAAHRQQMKRDGRVRPVAERDLSVTEQVLEAASRWLEADGDEEFEMRRKVLLAACRRLGRKTDGEAVALGMQRAREHGVRLGRPPAVPGAEVRRVLKAVRTQALAAKVLGVSRSAVRRALKRSCPR